MTAALRDGPVFPYLLRPPETGSGPAPVVVVLHGYGSTAEGMLGLAPWLDPRLLVLVPQGPLPLLNDGFGWYPLGVGPVAPVLDLDRLEASRAGTLEFAARAAAAHGGDPERVYLLGYSQGAALALAVALTRPERLEGLVAMSGRVLPEILPHAAPPERLRGLPVLITHGVDDPTVPVAQGRAARDLLQGWGASVRYREYPVGHTLPPECLDEMAAWLTARLDQPRGAATAAAP